MTISLIRRPASATAGGEVSPDGGLVRIGSSGVLTFGSASLGYSNFHSFNGSIVIGTGDPASLASASGSAVTTFQAFGTSIGRSGGLRLMSSDSSLSFDIYGATSDSATQPFAIGTTSNHGWRLLANSQSVANVSSAGGWSFGLSDSASISHVFVGNASPILTVRGNGTSAQLRLERTGTNAGSVYIGTADSNLRIGTTAGGIEYGSVVTGIWTLGAAGSTVTHLIHGHAKLVTGDSMFTARYTSISDDYAASIGWRTLQLGNNGGNVIAAGKTTAGGTLQFYTNVTTSNTGGGWTPDGILTLDLSNAGVVTLGSGTGQVHRLNTVTNGTAPGALVTYLRLNVNGTIYKIHLYGNT